MKFNFGKGYEIVKPEDRTVLKPVPDEPEKPKRWGKPFKDSRDWVKYNEELVARGEFLLDTEWVSSWHKELESMNNAKRGAPYQFPESLIKLQAVWHQWIDYRGIEGVTRKLAEYGIVPGFNDYTTISRRVNRTNVSIELPKEGTVNVSCDGSGMKMTNSGEYRVNKYGGRRRKYISVKIAADPITKELLACDVSVSGEGLSEPETAEKQMKELVSSGLNIIKAWGDGAYDTHKLFNFCQRNGIETAIKIRSNSSTRARGSMRRSSEVKEYQKKGYKKWAKEKEYGQRWTGTEGIFSAVKRKFGEGMKSRNKPNICHEAEIKFWAYQKMKNYAKNMT